MLTPLGDPPLFLGFLRGVPFGWTMRLCGPWLLVNGVLLGLFAGIDGFFYRREASPRVARRRRRDRRGRLRLRGR